MAVKIFFCYAHEDEPLLNELKAHLRPLQYQGLIEIWHDREISAGTEWEEAIKEQLNSAQIILLLISPAFMNSDYCYGVEMKKALERHNRREAQVIPVILRHVYWQGVLGNLQALPTDAKPVLDRHWHNLDEAFFNVAEGIRTVVEQMASPPAFASLAVPAQSSITAIGTTNAEKNPYPPYTGTLVLNDPLLDNSLGNSMGYEWASYSVNSNGAGCQFAEGGYHAIEQQNYVNVCHLSMVVSNFAFEVQMAVLTGTCGGIAFHDDTIIAAYHFQVCQDGTYQLYRYDSSNSHPTLASGSSSAIKTGLQQSNLLAVVAINDKFDLFVNHQQIANVSDNKYRRGNIGLRANPAGEVIYSNAKLWKL